MSLLNAVKAGIFVVQAAGNTGPSPKSVSSFSPWIFTVGASAHDRIYSNHLVLGNNLKISGVGLARKFKLSTSVIDDKCESSICLVLHSICLS